MTRSEEQDADGRLGLEFERVLNLRDLGGLPTSDGRRVRRGQLYRSAHLGRATTADIARLNALGLRTVVDFRNVEDVETDGADPALDGVQHVSMPLSDPADGAAFWDSVRTGGAEKLRPYLGDGQGEQHMIAGYRKYVRERRVEHGRFLRLLADGATVPALWHCSVGKDRAGWSTVIVLLALGVEADAIEADYLATNEAYARVSTPVPGQLSDPETLELMRPLFEARKVYLRTAWETAIEDWGSLEGYLADGLDFDAARQQQLRERLLEG